MQNTGTELVVVALISGNSDGAKGQQHLANTESQLKVWGGTIGSSKTFWHSNELKHEINVRLRECGLESHPEKTQIVFCKNSNLQGTYEWQSFDFLGYCFRPSSAKAIRQKIKQWRLGHKIQLSLEEIARQINPYLRGWINYYGAFNHSLMINVFQYLETRLFKYVKRKYKKRCRHLGKAKKWFITINQIYLFIGRKVCIQKVKC